MELIANDTCKNVVTFKMFIKANFFAEEIAIWKWGASLVCLVYVSSEELGCPTQRICLGYFFQKGTMMEVVIQILSCHTYLKI